MSKQHGRDQKSLFLKGSVQYLLEQGTLKDMRAAKELTKKLLKYHWNYYSELARQRNEIQDEIKKALIQKSESNYEFKYWQRGVKYKYGLHPLSTAGSLCYIGGRFNTGTDVNSEAPSFPALYIAKDKDTTLQEHLGQKINGLTSKLTPRELALTNPSSETIVSVSGKLDKVFDLTNINNLLPFLELIKTFSISKTLMQVAKKLGVPIPGIIKNPELLLKSLLDPQWRDLPNNADIPANSQIFGHLIYSAGIEGILYPSKFTEMPCLTIFPRNFPGTDSYICLDDETPHKKVPTKIDAANWRACDLVFNEISDADDF